ncbi:hypothetical protein I7I53_07003 [Histoplasma capsulatum var. duboisii H88]|uniref:Uncharacterized protein n=1 Tax=Ajellomyces capsulatus (strain H88) TaxID=544711 RepID=A0A8A1LCJ0_AJEC8|nr:hypothetical protein I7I53_07003 [Histoplasma capsulatum var. duboisii H88]
MACMMPQIWKRYWLDTSAQCACSAHLPPKSWVGRQPQFQALSTVEVLCYSRTITVKPHQEKSKDIATFKLTCGMGLMSGRQHEQHLLLQCYFLLLILPVKVIRMVVFAHRTIIPCYWGFRKYDGCGLLHPFQMWWFRLEHVQH